jgi:hypothetical protein
MQSIGGEDDARKLHCGSDVSMIVLGGINHQPPLTGHPCPATMYFSVGIAISHSPVAAPALAIWPDRPRAKLRHAHDLPLLVSRLGVPLA